MAIQKLSYKVVYYNQIYIKADLGFDMRICFDINMEKPKIQVLNKNVIYKKKKYIYTLLLSPISLL